MKKIIKHSLKRLAQWKYATWTPRETFEDGYAIFILSPMDMPFLLRFTLEGLRFIDTSRCREILVLPDGWSDDDGAALKNVMKEFNDPRIRYVPMSKSESMIGRMLGDTYWLIVIQGINAATTRHAFLHDADAFFLDTKGIENIYQAALDNNYDTVGVTPRWDPFFTNIGYKIPGTWELVFSLPWIRRWKPHHVRGQNYETPHGINAFDHLLYPQYMDYSQGRVGVMDNPPELVHFNGTIVTYRVWKRSGGKSVTDELYRLLLISLLEELMPSANGVRIIPPISTLVRGLTEDDAPIRYSRLKRPYVIFHQLDQLCRSPVFVGERGKRLIELVAPFDEFYATIPLESEEQGDASNRFRSHGLA